MWTLSDPHVSLASIYIIHRVYLTVQHQTSLCFMSAVVNLGCPFKMVFFPCRFPRFLWWQDTTIFFPISYPRVLSRVWSPCWKLWSYMAGNNTKRGTNPLQVTHSPFTHAQLLTICQLQLTMFVDRGGKPEYPEEYGMKRNMQTPHTEPLWRLMSSKAMITSVLPSCTLK